MNLKTHKKQYLVILNKLGLIVLKNSMKERKKYGLKGARRAPQFSKR
ncbi:30S ribosomal protein S9 [Listeria seeligeri]|nr:30S ribosomal protein S9 [Listeria seeligeri]